VFAVAARRGPPTQQVLGAADAAHRELGTQPVLVAAVAAAPATRGQMACR
jgi:hypothetical protein